MTPSVFADTAYWIALLNPRELHERAHSVSAMLQRSRIVTSEFVLTELLNAFAGFGPALRTAAVDLVEALRTDPNVDVVPAASVLFRRAVDRYRARVDKEWSLVDCTSFLIMEERHIENALAHDRHFKQAGFKALLSTNQ